MKVEFNKDGSVKPPKNVPAQAAKTQELPIISILRLIDELEFPVGRKLLSQILRGEENARIKRLGLDTLAGYGRLAMHDHEDIIRLLNEMSMKSLIETTRTRGYLPVLAITDKGFSELENPTDKQDYSIQGTAQITDKDRAMFNALSYLDKYNDMQKKAIIDPSGCILCVAGAGTGKTTVLTRRIEFLCRYRAVKPDNILAITFTRKARREMISRLSDMIPCHSVHIETFNSFAEKILKQHHDKVYDRPYRVMDFKDKIKAITSSLSEMGYTVQDALKEYFTKKKLRENDDKQLFFSLINDIFGLMDNLRNNDRQFSEIAQTSGMLCDKKIIMLVHKLVEKTEEYKEKHGLRDYTDQLLHTIKLFRKQSSTIPEYEHILVDEYQDVNFLQVQLLNLLGPKNLFVVGDPRQSIYGWRGSKIDYILDFRKHHPNSTVIQLTKNYRSAANIVKAGNTVIRSMLLPDLKAAKQDTVPIALLCHNDENAESVFVAQSILAQSIQRKQIFILARTNRQLEHISEVLARHNIRFLKRTVEEQKQETEPDEDEVTLSTVHAIKGLEAELVYLIGVNSQMYPCQASESPVIDAVKNDDYDKYNEELRLLYVAMTRAKTRLVINYYNSLSCFITEDVKAVLSPVHNGSRKENVEARLREWRRKKAAMHNLRPYMIINDKTLLEIASVMPHSLGELYVIKGIGESKIMKYGDEILDIVSGLS